MSAVADQIRKIFNNLWEEDHEGPPPPLEPDTILLETGFDSMAFAVLVAQLDDDLGVDPFALDMDAETPVTFADFVGFYERCLASMDEASSGEAGHQPAPGAAASLFASSPASGQQPVPQEAGIVAMSPLSLNA